MQNVLHRHRAIHAIQVSPFVAFNERYSVGRMTLILARAQGNVYAETPFILRTATVQFTLHLTDDILYLFLPALAHSFLQRTPTRTCTRTDFRTNTRTNKIYRGSPSTKVFFSL